MTYDRKCAELAESFLNDANIATLRTIDQLASEIQTTIEDFISRENEQREAHE